jgi:protein-tyrosine phosphatase
VKWVKSEMFVDVHCHCLPNLDDGPESLGEAVALCRALVDDNVASVVATPHQLGRFEGRTTAAAIREGIQDLSEELGKNGISLELFSGAEVRLDERIGPLLAGGEILTLADMQQHILLELPNTVFLDIEPLIVQLRDAGVEVVIAHPERNVPLLRQLPTLRRWLDCGASLQVNAGCLTGRFGREVQLAAGRLVVEGWAALVGTDAHGQGVGGPGMTAAFEMIERHLGSDVGRLLCVENPSRVVRGESLAFASACPRKETW